MKEYISFTLVTMLDEIAHILYVTVIKKLCIKTELQHNRNSLKKPLSAFHIMALLLFHIHTFNAVLWISCENSCQIY